MTEQELACVIAAQKGGAGDFEELFRMFYKRVYVLANSRLRDATAAEDVSQQTLIAVWEKLDTLQEPEAFGGWLSRITINNCNAALRKRSRRREVFADSFYSHQENSSGDVSDRDGGNLWLDDKSLRLADAGQTESVSPEAHAEHADLQQHLNSVISELNSDQRDAIILYYYHQLSVNEVAAATGAGVSTVKSRLNQARQHIKKHLQAEDTRTGSRYFGAAGMGSLGLGALLSQHFVAQEPPAASIDDAYRQFSQTAYGADGAVPVAGAVSVAGAGTHEVPLSPASSAATAAAGGLVAAGNAYIDEYVAQMRQILAVELPLLPCGKALPDLEPALDLPGEASDQLKPDCYLQALRDYAQRLQTLELQYLHAGESLQKQLG